MSSPDYPMLINGELVSKTEHSFDVVNPSTGKVLAKAPHASKAQVDQAVQAAVDAFPAWAAKSLEERKEYMKKIREAFSKLKDTLVPLLVREQGKPVGGATFEVAFCDSLFEHALNIEVPVKVVMDNEEFRTEVRRKPVGIVAGITPWNFPLFCSVQKWAPAIVLGNTFVWKPSPFTPLTALACASMLKDILPKGVLNIVTGDDQSDFNVGAYLTNHPNIRKVSFTGSVPTGKKIMSCAANDVKRITLEMGGNDAAIVREDCDPKEVAPKLFSGAFMNSGQVCCAIKRCFVHESIYDNVVDELVSCAKKAKMGDGFEEGVEYGPLCNSMQFEKVKDIVEDAKKNGAVIHCGGKARENTDGYFYEPTIVTNVKEGVRIVDDEQFGPVLPVLSYKTDKEALSRANATSYGLGGSVWSSDKKAANELGSNLLAGTVWVNEHATITGGPFGGFKYSGLGRELGHCDVDAFTEIQTVKLAKL